MMHWNYQLSEEEIEAIVTKMDELNGPFSEESTDPLREKRKAALRGWLIIGVKDMLTAMQALDYGIVRVKTGVFIETHECNAALAQSQVPASLDAVRELFAKRHPVESLFFEQWLKELQTSFQ